MRWAALLILLPAAALAQGGHYEPPSSFAGTGMNTDAQSFSGAKTFSTSLASPSISSSAASGSNGFSLLEGARLYLGNTNSWISCTGNGICSIGSGTTGTKLTAAELVGLNVVRATTYNPAVTAVPLKLTSEQTNAAATATNPGGWFHCFNALDAGKTCFDVRNSASTQMFTVMGDGKVGVGTNAPSAKLQINVGDVSNSVQINSTASWPNLALAIDGTVKTYIGVARAASDIVTGSTTNDFVIRTATEPVLFNLDSGGLIHGEIDTVGTYHSGAGVQVNRLAVAKPICGSGNRGTFWYVAGGAGVADTMEVCAKSAADSYAWRSTSVLIP